MGPKWAIFPLFSDLVMVPRSRFYQKNRFLAKIGKNVKKVPKSTDFWKPGRPPKFLGVKLDFFGGTKKWPKSVPHFLPKKRVLKRV